MNTLIISCCGPKLDQPAAALDLYQNRAFAFVREHLTDDFTVLILSAKYWLITADRITDPYEQKMTKQIAKGMHTWCAPGYTPLDLRRAPGDVYVYGGKPYREVIQDWCGRIDRKCHEVIGANRGIGDHYSALTKLAK